MNKSRNAVKTTAVILSVLMALLSVAGLLGYFLTHRDTKVGGSVIDGDGNTMVEGEVYNMPTAMVFKPLASTSTISTEKKVNVKAIIEPLDAVDQAVKWSVYFKNSSSEWARGKQVSDYVTINDTTALTNTVTFKKAFGEQIIIRVVPNDRPDLNDTCTVDCGRIIKKSFVTYSAIKNEPKDADLVLNSSIGSLSNRGNLKILLETSAKKIAMFTYEDADVYTLNDSFTTNVVIKPNAKMMEEARKINPSAVQGEYDASVGIVPNRAFMEAMFGKTFATDLNLYKLGKVLNSTVRDAAFEVTITVNGTYTKNAVTKYYVSYNATDIGKGVEGIRFDKDTIVF